jgi:hypothetical protein
LVLIKPSYTTTYTCSNINRHTSRQIIKKINQTTLQELSFEYWEEVSNEVDVNNMFNKFLNIFLISFNGTIQEKKIIYKKSEEEKY